MTSQTKYCDFHKIIKIFLNILVYKDTLAIFCIICIAALYFSLGWQTAASFLVGALCSGIAGFIGHEYPALRCFIGC